MTPRLAALPRASEEGDARVSDWMLEMKNIVKEFSGVRALDGVTFQVRKGEIHALCGENGAGKSTLMKILSGVYPSGTYTGEIYLAGEPVHFRSVRDAERAGIAIIYQELALVPEFTVAENIFLGREPTEGGIISQEALNREAQHWLEVVGLTCAPSSKVKNLGVGEQQLVEIAKALKNRAQLLILDEPTAALSDREAERLLEIMRQLKASGVTCIYISHRLAEVLAIADTVTVLRDGKSIVTRPVADVTEREIITHMVGRTLTDIYPPRSAHIGSPVLRVSDWSVTSRSTGRRVVDRVSFEVRSGEVVALAGLVGAGRTELVTSLFGVYSGNVEGTLEVDGRPVVIRSPQDAIRNGIALVPEDRKKQGLVLGMDVLRNLTLSALSKLPGRFVIDPDSEVRTAATMVDRLKVKSPSLETPVQQLSGGNQQKVVIGKWLLVKPRVLMLDEPTRGVDVGAKYEIYQLINELAEQGIAVLMVSSDLPEVLGMSDRILVMSQGRITGELIGKRATQEQVMELATRGR
jgi:D-xylose transport system ATP-binding protein